MLRADFLLRALRQNRRFLAQRKEEIAVWRISAPDLAKRPNRDHYERENVAENFALNDLARRECRQWFTPSFHEVYANSTVVRSQYTRSDFDNTSKDRRITNHSVRAVARKTTDVLCPFECSCQRLSSCAVAGIDARMFSSRNADSVAKAARLSLGASRDGLLQFRTKQDSDRKRNRFQKSTLSTSSAGFLHVNRTFIYQGQSFWIIVEGSTEGVKGFMYRRCADIQGQGGNLNRRIVLLTLFSVLPVGA